MAVADLLKQINTKREELGALLEKHKDGETYKVTSAERQEIASRNSELTDLSKELEVLRIAEHNEAELKELAKPQNGVPFGGSVLGGVQEAKGLGDMFVESKAFQIYRGIKENGGEAKCSMPYEAKTLFSTSAGYPPQVVRSGRVVLSAQQGPVVVDLIPAFNTDQNAYKYMSETTYTNSAAELAENGTYAESAWALTEVTEPVRKLGHTVPMTEEVLEDVEGVRDYLNQRLEFGIRQRLDNQLINGNGTTPNLKGLLNVAGIQTQAKGTDPNPDAIRKAATKVMAVGFANASGVIMNPTDWDLIRLLRGSTGQYLFGDPGIAGVERIFGLPVVLSTFMGAGTAIVADFAMYTGLVVRREVSFEVTNSHASEFLNGVYRVRAAIRVGFPVYRAAAVCTVTGIA